MVLARSTSSVWCHLKLLTEAPIGLDPQEYDGQRSDTLPQQEDDGVSRRKKSTDIAHGIIDR